MSRFFEEVLTPPDSSAEPSAFESEDEDEEPDDESDEFDDVSASLEEESEEEVDGDRRLLEMRRPEPEARDARSGASMRLGCTSGTSAHSPSPLGEVYPRTQAQLDIEDFAVTVLI